MLIPVEYLADFYFPSIKESDVALSSWLDQLVQLCDPIDADKSSAVILLRACRLICRHTREWQNALWDRNHHKASFSNHLLGKVIRAGLRLSDRSICCEALRSAVIQLPQPETVEAIDHFGFEELQTE